MLLLGSGSLLPLLLLVPQVFFLLLLLELPRVVQSSSCFTVSPHLLNLTQLPNTLLMSCVQQLIQAPVKQCNKSSSVNSELSVLKAVKLSAKGASQGRRQYLVACRMLAVDRDVTPSREALVLLLYASGAMERFSGSTKPYKA